tara:strand:- start:27 stop:557 length:531 start_codon:yes stop_codon:yes gene_type:complete
MNNFKCLIISTLLFNFSCLNFNSSSLKELSELEYKISLDKKKISHLKTFQTKKNLQLAKNNFLLLESMSLDSISFELIYFKYKDYLSCVNNIYSYVEIIEILNEELKINEVQLSNLIKEHQSSRRPRLDLNSYVENEKKLIESTSKKINELHINLKHETLRFDSLNLSIEKIINAE